MFFLAVFSAANATQIRECYKEKRQPYWRVLERVVPPEHGVRTNLVTEFCEADAHKISDSMPIGTEPLECYTSTQGELVIELPNEYFNSCREPEELISLYATKWAYYSFEPVVIVVYNEDHKFIRTSEYLHDHAVFESVRYQMEKQAIGRAFLEAVESGKATYSDLAKCASTKDIGIQNCPPEVLRFVKYFNGSGL